MKRFFHCWGLVNAVVGMAALFYSTTIRVGTRPEQALRIVLTGAGLGIVAALIAIATKD